MNPVLVSVLEQAICNRFDHNQWQYSPKCPVVQAHSALYPSLTVSEVVTQLCKFHSPYDSMVAAARYYDLTEEQGMLALYQSATFLDHLLLLAAEHTGAEVVEVGYPMFDAYPNLKSGFSHVTLKLNEIIRHLDTTDKVLAFIGVSMRVSSASAPLNVDLKMLTSKTSIKTMCSRLAAVEYPYLRGVRSPQPNQI